MKDSHETNIYSLRTGALRGLRAWLPLVILVWTTTTGLSADVSGGFDSANRLYEQGKFSEAASAYENLIQSGTISPALYFNLGNAFFKSGQLGHAVAAYRGAEKLTPRDPDVRANLQFVRGKIQGPTTPPPRWQGWLSGLTINEWAGLTAVVFWVWLVLIIVIQVRPALKVSLRALIWCGGAATLIFGGILWSVSSGDSTKTAIVVAPDAIVHNGPLDESPTGGTVHDGAELSVLDTKNDWLQVRVDAQRVGWLKREQVVVVSGS